CGRKRCFRHWLGSSASEHTSSAIMFFEDNSNPDDSAVRRGQFVEARFFLRRPSTGRNGPIQNAQTGRPYRGLDAFLSSCSTGPLGPVRFFSPDLKVRLYTGNNFFREKFGKLLTSWVNYRRLLLK